MLPSRQAYLWFAIIISLCAAALRIVGLAHYPPGPHFDEAANLIITRTVAFGGAHYFPMVENYQGREVLYYYLSAPFLMLVQDSRFALQLVGVYSNLVLVAATITLGRLMFPGRRGVMIGLAAGIVAAVSLPQILLARQAFRAITLPMMQALALILLWRGLRARRRGWIWLLIGGIIAGASVYTYNSSRLFPFWLVIGGAALLAFSAGERVHRLRQGVVFFLPVIAIALPFAVYAFQKPDIFFGRLYEVSGGEDAITLWESTVLHARMFFIHGETLLRYNPTGRPYFTWPEGMLLLAGAVSAVVVLFRGRSYDAVSRAACVLVLLSPLMVVPGVLATSGFPPNHMRSIAMVPLVFIMVGMGFERVVTWLPGVRWPFVLLAIGLAGGVAHTGRDYTAWVTRADLYYDTDADLAAAAQWAEQTLPEDVPVYVAAGHRFHPTVTVFDTPPVRWTGVDTLFVPPEGERVVIFPRSAPPPDDWRVWLDAGAQPVADLPVAPDGRTAFEAWRLAADTHLPDDLSLPAHAVENETLSLSATYTGQALPAGRVTVLTGWQVTAPPVADDLTPIIHMEDANGNRVARADVYSVGSQSWEAGETMLQRVGGLRVPVGTPPGTYPLKITWVERENDRYLPYRTADDAFAGVWADAGYIEVIRANAFPEPDALPADVRMNTPVANGIALIGWNNIPAAVRPGEQLPLTLHWHAPPVDSTRSPFEVAIRLGEVELDADFTFFDEHPVTGWIDGQLMTQRTQATIPLDIAAGNYPLMLAAGDVEILIGDVDVSVQGVARLFSPPPVARVYTTPGESPIQLHGYTLTTQNDEVLLEVVWLALERPTKDYTVFVHLVDAAGTIIEQRDVMPVDGSYPTSLWTTDEYIMDEHHFTLPDVPVSVRVGLYAADSGERLPLDNITEYIEIPLPVDE